MDTARLFTYAGVNIWRKPLADEGRPLTPDELAALPQDIQTITHLPTPGVIAYSIPGWPKDKPFLSSWSGYPRFHPPGDLLLTAPIAALYSFTNLSLSGANRLLILLFIIFAHVSIYLLFRSALAGKEVRAVGFLALFLAYGEIIHWTLEGFYEAATIAPLILCAKYLYERRAAEALLCFGVALMLHFRALYFVPYAGYALFLIVRDRQWQTWTVKHYVELALAGVLTAISGFVFVTLWPYLKTLPINNPVSIQAPAINTHAVITFVIVMTLVCGVLAFARSWLDVVLGVWLTILLFFFHQAFPWDILTLLAWLGAPIALRVGMRTTLVRDARLVAVGFIAFFIFMNSLWPIWITKIV
jgi:hypothetical protein